MTRNLGLGDTFHLRFVCTYYLALSGNVHALVSACGADEHNSKLRSKVGEAVRCLGFATTEECSIVEDVW